ncbi:OmpA family protein [Zoogloea dura]|jgi:outer membrane protein OmpA-like peptidoglycan-associated protein|uniref:OmpA family protein n=1 Tax=Zoogloea dura TaxID=2728840 RepID=A0A848GAI7_9RHOO|nr:OmpA family protein [Zoogloea dura]NML28390.1 OmpA family protein [Zoogloea dura]
MFRFITRVVAYCLAASVLAACTTTPPASSPVAPMRLPVSQLDRGVLVWLPEDILFDFGRAELNPVLASPYMDRIAWLLNERTVKSVSLEGHTDSVGSENGNRVLSVNRAIAVRQALVARGVPESRLAVLGHGFSRPIAPNDSEAGRRVNRRVEIVILGEEVDKLTRGDADGAFEAAFSKLKAELNARFLARERTSR